MKAEIRFQVNRPAEEVFDFLADLRNESRWNPRVLTITQVTPGTIGKGTRFRGRYRGVGTLETVLSEHDRPRLIAFRSSGPMMRIEGAFRLSGEQRTDVALDADLQPRGPLRPLEPVVRPLFQRQNRAAAERLKAVLDAPP